MDIKQFYVYPNHTANVKQVMQWEDKRFVAWKKLETMAQRYNINYTKRK